MAQIDPMHRHGGNPKSTTTPTIEQLLGAGDAQTWSPRSNSSSSTSARSHEVHDPEDVQYHSKKLTVLAKVKEKARRWRHSFIKKRHSEGDNPTPSGGVRLEHEVYEEEDPEYFGAPMYELELAPKGYKENARQHPRAIPVIPEKHVLASSVLPVSGQGKKEPTSAEAKATDATQTIASKIQGLLVSAPTGSETEKQATRETNKRATHKTSKYDTHEADKYATQETDKHALKTENPYPFSPRENKWDKGVSVKEYIMNKLEPGEDEKALSQVISDAISPRKTPGDVGVMVKVKGAVNSLLWREEPAQSTIKHSDTNSSSHIPISTNAQAVTKEEYSKPTER
ncbi:hypothetical protein CRYUN_Cryun02cG0186300 [Craigia yunnanensis]